MNPSPELLASAQKVLHALKQAEKDVTPLVGHACGGRHPDLSDLAKRLGHEVSDAYDRAKKFYDQLERRLKLEAAKKDVQRPTG